MDVEPWPRLVVFAIALRDPLPLPHGATFTRELNEQVDGLGPLNLQIEDDPSSGRVGGGSAPGQVVSLRVWQLRHRSSNEEYDLAGRAFAVLDHVAGTSTGEPPHSGADGENDDYRTVVEALTFVAGPDEMALRENHVDPLTRCLQTLFEVVRAYRLIGHAQISELTYERIAPLVPYRWRRLTPPEFLGTTQLMMLDHTNVSTPTPDTLSEALMQTYAHHLERLISANPFTLYMERRLEAKIAHERDGQYAEAAIQSAIAAEVLLDGLLGMLLWEEARESDDLASATAVLSAPATKRVRTAFHPRLGGGWSITADGPLRRWFVAVAGLRNRVVHRGYRPTRSESADAILVLEALEQFVCDRLAVHTDRYPRTALAVLGADGLRRRNRWDDRRFRSDVIGAIQSEMRHYRAWRTKVDDAMTLRRTT